MQALRKQQQASLSAELRLYPSSATSKIRFRRIEQPAATSNEDRCSNTRLQRVKQQLHGGIAFI